MSIDALHNHRVSITILNADFAPGPNLSTAVIDYFHGHLYALKASSTLRRYVEDVNNSIAHKLEVILGSLNAEIRVDKAKSMKDAAVIGN